MAEKPSIPKGTRDFGPAQMAKRQFIFDSIKKVFQKYGFQPLETPAMENLTTLTGKYGEEGDQLLFKILDSGGYFEKSIAKIKDALSDFLKYILNDYFNSVDGGREDRSRAELESIIWTYYKKETWSSSRYLNSFQKLNFSEFIETEMEYIIREIAAFLNAAELWKDNFEQQKFERNFLQFRDNAFNERILPKALKYINLKENQFTQDISEKGLRYDLTVPFARYVVMNKSEITFPFKRYQMQPVWRADKPQKGRYREFYQCDADVVGTNSLICEAEIILMIKDVFKGLNILDYTIKINHRGVLAGLAELTGCAENQNSLFVAIDKLEKIGETGVRGELNKRGISESSLEILFNVLNFKGTNEEKIGFLSNAFSDSQTGQKGLSDFKEVLNLLRTSRLDDEHIEFDIALARGLSYYTGCIFEVKINNVSIGSVSGGGRYDNLTSMFGDKENLSGVGFSFGVDRLYDAMTEIELKESRKLFPIESSTGSKVLICYSNRESMLKGLYLLNLLRNVDIPSEIYLGEVKIKKPLEKPFQYAEKKSIPFVVNMDSTEDFFYSFKKSSTGENWKLSIDDAIKMLKTDY